MKIFLFLLNKGIFKFRKQPTQQLLSKYMCPAMSQLPYGRRNKMKVSITNIINNGKMSKEQSFK